jgi:hypothetical protein
MNERLSSVLVPIYKLFPLIPLVPMAFRSGWLLTHGFRREQIVGVLFLLAWSAVFFLITRKWRVVYLRDNMLVIYRLWKRIEIPVSEAIDVQASSWWGSNPRRITIKLRSDTEVGDQIVFVPKGLGFAETKAKRIRELLNLKEQQ